MIILPLMKLPIIYGSNETNQNSEAPSDNSSRAQNTSNENNSEQSASPIETEIASFTTKIYTKDSDRQNNISITCSSLNDTTIENGQTFSFCNTVGKATSSKGYKKADVFKDGEKIEALGRWQLPSKFYLI
jgi:vancomycin resistance protein YoaR